MRKRQSNAGFTLVEVIISIAVLSIASVFILQMFVTSNQLNANARDIDKANMLIKTSMQRFYLVEEPEGLSTVLSEIGSIETITEGETIVIRIYFDKNWEPLASGAQAEAVYIYEAHIAPIEKGVAVPVSISGDGIVLRGVDYALEVNVYRANVRRENQILASSKTSNYFQIEEEAS